MTEVKPEPMDPRIPQWVESGIPVADAVRIALGGSLPQFAARHGLNRSVVAMVVAGQRFPTPTNVIEALIKELGGTEAEWRALFYRAVAPEGLEEARLLGPSTATRPAAAQAVAQVA